jgi:hypothetical protein
MPLAQRTKDLIQVKRRQERLVWTLYTPHTNGLNEHILNRCRHIFRKNFYALKFNHSSMDVVNYVLDVMINYKAKRSLTSIVMDEETSIDKTVLSKYSSDEVIKRMMMTLHLVPTYDPGYNPIVQFDKVKMFRLNASPETAINKIVIQPNDSQLEQDIKTLCYEIPLFVTEILQVFHEEDLFNCYIPTPQALESAIKNFATVMLDIKHIWSDTLFRAKMTLQKDEEYFTVTYPQILQITQMIAAFAPLLFTLYQEEAIRIHLSMDDYQFENSLARYRMQTIEKLQRDQKNFNKRFDDSKSKGIWRNNEMKDIVSLQIATGQAVTSAYNKNLLVKRKEDWVVGSTKLAKAESACYHADATHLKNLMRLQYYLYNIPCAIASYTTKSLYYVWKGTGYLTKDTRTRLVVSGCVVSGTIGFANYLAVSYLGIGFMTIFGVAALGMAVVGCIALYASDKYIKWSQYEQDKNKLVIYKAVFKNREDLLIANTELVNLMKNVKCDPKLLKGFEQMGTDNNKVMMRIKKAEERLEKQYKKLWLC